MKRIFALLFVFTTLATYAQEGTASPYSYFGIGDVKPNATVESRAMGGVSAIPDSIHVNLQNPAMLTQLKWINYTLGMTYNTVKLNTADATESARRSTLDYLSYAFPSNKMAFSLLIMPYSSVGYKVQNLDEVNGKTTQFNGKGGLNKAMAGFAYQINTHWSVGVQLGVLFGKIETNSTLVQTGIQFGTREQNTSNLSGFAGQLGLAYYLRRPGKPSFNASLTYSPQLSLTSNNQRFIYASDAVSITVPNSTLRLPSLTTMGFGYGVEKKWYTCFEMSLQGKNELAERYSTDSNTRYQSAYRIALGGYFIPNYSSFNSYYKRMVYRAGVRMGQTGLVINDTSIQDLAATAGLGFPIGGLLSNANFTVELGRLGTTSNGLIQENYINFSLGFSFNDKWFVKRKYD